MSSEDLEDPKIITEEYTREKYKNVKLEDMNSYDVLHRYGFYGSDEELDNPEIQELLKKHGLSSLLDVRQESFEKKD